MGELHVQHGGQRGAKHRDELGWVCAEVRVHQVHSRQLKEGENGWESHKTCDLQCGNIVHSQGLCR